MSETPIFGSVSTKLQRIAELARESPQRSFLSLAHHIDLPFLREAYRRTRKDGAPGVDGQEAAQYAEQLEGNLLSLLDRFKSGSYKAPPVRRVYIPKGDGTKVRPIGIPTFEDKVLQRAVVMVLEAVYEQDFLDCSYGFRPGRSAHQALHAFWRQAMDWGGGWVLEIDIQSFFDSVDHRTLRNFLDQRVRDGVLRRAIDKWLNAGVLEGGEWSHGSEGTPQGGVISPLLANLYLHEVLDVWFQRDVLPRLRGGAAVYRFADDAILLFREERDARRVWEVLSHRFAKYGLTLHPDKTRLVYFKPDEPRPEDRSSGAPRLRSFDFLGFTHFWGQSKKGRPVVKRKTAKSRFTRATRVLTQWCRWNRHEPVAWQHEQLGLRLRGHYSYYGITGNYPALRRLKKVVEKAWRKWLNRRNRRGDLTMERFRRLLERYPMPVPLIYHQV